MDENFHRVLARYTARMQEERRIFTEQPHRVTELRDQLLLSIGEDVARVLHSLAVARGGKGLG
ncbi:MAG TPA: hypothetical protein VF815_45240 [Myxococcaceae bacterium]|jgi:hypothetical protein